MKLHLFLSTVAAACWVLPASALADPPPDHGQGAAKNEQAQPRGRGAEKGKGAEGRRQGGGEPPGQAAKARELRAAPGPQAQPGGHRGRQQAQAVAPIPAPQRVERAPAAPSFQRAVPTPPTFQREPGVRAGQQQIPPGVRAGQQPYQNQPFARQAAPPPLEGWRAPPRGPERDRAGQQWRQQHQSWDQYAAWRQRPDWWRNDSGFRLFSGLRLGFFFVPEMGYIALPHQYRDRHWDVGDYLPSWFWRYTVRDYARYGLPRPPPGCVWVWLNGDIALIDRSDGYILDIARHVW